MRRVLPALAGHERVGRLAGTLTVGIKVSPMRLKVPTYLCNVHICLLTILHNSIFYAYAEKK